MSNFSTRASLAVLSTVAFVNSAGQVSAQEKQDEKVAQPVVRQADNVNNLVLFSGSLLTGAVFGASLAAIGSQWAQSRAAERSNKH